MPLSLRKNNSNVVSSSIIIFVIFVIGYFSGRLAYNRAKGNTIEEVRTYRVDSITSRLKYEVMPERVYIYHTALGAIFAPPNKYQVGDSIEIKIIRYEK